MIKKIVILMFFTTLSTASIVSGATQVCVSRAEHGGVLNIRPAEITANGKHILWIVGGESKCVDMSPGQYSIVAQSSDPYDPNDKKPASWNSKPLSIKIKNDEKVDIVVLPISTDAGYTGPWLLKKQ